MSNGKKILEVKNLSISFKNGPNQIDIVKNISFSLSQGKILGIVGESGSGKSLTALSILGLLPYPKAFHSHQSSIKYKEIELINNPELPKYRGAKFGFIFQEPMSSLNPLHTIGRQVAEILIIHQNLTFRQAKEETLKLLKLTGIRNAQQKFNAYPHELSGGQRQRVMIAMAVANHPDILIADEPTTALDATIQKQIIELLLKLQAEYKMSIIFISHDLKLVQHIADDIIVMHNGEIVEQGVKEKIFLEPQNNYTKKLINASSVLKNTNSLSGDTILDIQNLTVKYPQKKNFWGTVTQYLYAVNNVSFSLKYKENLGIVGESGSGKTTLGQAICRLIKYEGKINYYKIENKNFHKSIQIVFQDPFNSLNPRMTIEQIVGEGLKIHYPQMLIKDKKEKIVRTLNEVGLKADDLYKYPHEFSGGQRQRIAIARALILEPQLLILDEPTSALDITIQKQILTLLQNIQQNRELTYIFISHDLNAVSAIANKIAVMQNGKIIEMDDSQKIFNTPCNPYTRNLIEAFK